MVALVVAQVVISMRAQDEVLNVAQLVAQVMAKVVAQVAVQGVAPRNCPTGTKFDSHCLFGFFILLSYLYHKY